MSNSENTGEQGMEDDPPGQQIADEQATPFEKLVRLQNDIEGQGQRVAAAIKPIAERLDKGENIALEMISHARAQILLAHLQLDDLEQLLDTID